MFWTDNITNLLVEKTSLYSTQVRGTSMSTSSHEIEHFLGIHDLMGIMKLPVYDMYWPTIADATSNKRCKQLCKCIHVVDNTTKENPEKKNHKLFKIRPTLEGIRANYIKIEPEEVQSIDKQIVPGKRNPVEYANTISKAQKMGIQNVCTSRTIWLYV